MLTNFRSNIGHIHCWEDEEEEEAMSNEQFRKTGNNSISPGTPNESWQQWVVRFVFLRDDDDDCGSNSDCGCVVVVVGLPCGDEGGGVAIRLRWTWPFERTLSMSVSTKFVHPWVQCPEHHVTGVVTHRMNRVTSTGWIWGRCVRETTTSRICPPESPERRFPISIRDKVLLGALKLRGGLVGCGSGSCGSGGGGGSKSIKLTQEQVSYVVLCLLMMDGRSTWHCIIIMLKCWLLLPGIRWMESH